ncbi:hypothetical protein [Paraburkholderia sp. BCC1886]|uniref:hypothetical protein n=1 Tax=Paraburkholderia sp. BCC1886 TaxID=2562670 RepID=UPI0011844F22|nr:hypothetical protein [Paraburkholderia sp. BCC1886]
MSILPADWWTWTLGGGLSFVFLWLISVPPARGRFDRFDTGRGTRAGGTASPHQTSHGAS